MLGKLAGFVFIVGGVVMLIMASARGEISADTGWLTGAIYISVGSLLIHGRGK